MAITEKKYRITMTESQLRLMINAVEDWHRFLAGQCDMDYATATLDNRMEIKGLLRQIEKLIPPCDWAGNGVENEYRKKAVAMSYMLYRESLHYLTTHNGKDMSWNVYNGATLTCPEQGEMITIEEL